VTTFVIDAGIALKWVLDEPHSPAARSLLSGQHELIAPDLLYVEATNVLWKRVVRKEMTIDEASLCCAGLLAVPFIVHDSRTFLGRALSVAAATGNTVYDCLYVALALHSGCPVVTGDRKLVAALTRGGYGDAAVWIGDMVFG
jgi:predicted nucleic acid-binding protein